MAYLSEPFQYDVFISYAHGPAEQLKVSHLKNWSQRLKEELEGHIVDFKADFQELEVFIDAQLDPTAALTPQLRGKVTGSGLFLVMMSEHYLNSAWCTDERDWFSDETSRRVSSGGHVLVVRIQPTDHAKWPSCLKDERGHVVVGFRFHPNPADDSELVTPHGWPLPLPEDRPYYEELGKLASIVIQRLRSLKERQQLEAKASLPRSRLQIEGNPIVYLQASSSSSAAWLAYKDVLEQSGCRVLPEVHQCRGGDLQSVNEARKERLKALRSDVHALCLLNATDGDAADREIESIVSDRSALQAFDIEIPCAVINSRGGDLAVARNLDIHVVDATGDDWLVDLQNWLLATSSSTR